MPRRQFIADLAAAKTGTLPPGIRALTNGEDDGQFTFEIDAPTNETLEIIAIIPDVSEYPTSHEYMVYCGDDAPKQLATHVQKLKNAKGKTILQVIELIAAHISSYTSLQPSQTEAEADDFEDLEDELTDTYDDDDHFHTGSVPAVNMAAQNTQANARTTVASRNRVRSDLRQLKDAGFHISVLGDVIGGAPCYLSISIRMAKLGISEEAMQAWQVESTAYFMVILRFPAGYQTLEAFLEQTQQRGTASTAFEARVVHTKYKKPLAQDVVQAFQMVSGTETSGSNEVADKTSTTLHDTFISRSLVSLVDEYFGPLAKLRKTGMTWQGAADFYHVWLHSRSPEDENDKDAKYYEPEPRSSTLPAVVQADHLGSATPKDKSLPLVIMQFILRYFVRCVEFCVICHRKIEDDLEAIKPYVCDRPLCLYQYLTYGFGPSIEHEIMAQPRVVDLLISFCYTAADARRLQDPPVGLNIKVPPPIATKSAESHRQQVAPYGVQPTYRDNAADAAPDFVINQYEAKFDRDRREVVFSKTVTGGCPVARGTWIAIHSKGESTIAANILHCRVLETNFFPSIIVDEPIVVTAHWIPDGYDQFGRPVPDRSPNVPNKPKTPAATPQFEEVICVRYDVDLESMSHDQQCAAICTLLDTLPSIKHMQEYLAKNRSSSPNLHAWVERISPSALLVLRWIIASNRACIMQLEDATSSDSPSKNSKSELITGMPGFVQFRFAMGAPDKEQRFLAAVKTTTKRLKLKYPTAFAWHGSPLYNWHDIIRQGLHFKRVDHGRAYGDGVYHAYDANTSLGYTARAGRPWFNSALKVATALALNELVNARKEFVSSSPYLVINQLDWIQTRYLLVRCTSHKGSDSVTEPSNLLKQDPGFRPKGVDNTEIIIPATATKSARLRNAEGEAVTKKLKGTDGDPILIDTSSECSDESSDEDEDLLRMEVEALTGSFSQDLVDRRAKKSEGDFVPGSLDYTTLPMLPLPSYATSATTRRLMLEVQSMQKTLDATPARDLGWYMDFEKTENVYQWIVELHSFDTFEIDRKPLPLVADMKAQKVNSVVLEVRFGHDFPFSPPFIRVVRPRFKTVSEGGGGHVVMGGAMCMELLTNTGWSSISSMESVLLQVRLAIATKPFARLNTRTGGDYGAGEAADGYIRACRAHGWVEPPGFRALAFEVDKHT